MQTSTIEASSRSAEQVYFTTREISLIEDQRTWFIVKSSIRDGTLQSLPKLQKILPNNPLSMRSKRIEQISEDDFEPGDGASSYNLGCG